MVRVDERTSMVGGGQRRERAEIGRLWAGVGLLALGCCVAVAALSGAWGHERVVAVSDGEEEAMPLSAKAPWGVDFDIKFVRAKRQWQISNLVLHPPPPPAKKPKAPPMVVYKATFPYGELKTLNKAEKLVEKKLDDKDTDPALKDALKAGLEQKDGALESAVGCAEGSEPNSKIKTACPGVGSGKPRPVKRQWSMGFPPKVGSSAQEAETYKRRGLIPGDVDRGAMGKAG
mmetsp:Transcript_26179/g.63092  ORF Transcript_26179/g.63092 Transcript_26179/m.63092 type:complete len:231 (-) Transcript_26179:150-842(-)